MGAAADPLHHIDKMRAALSVTAAHLRQDILKVSDPLFQNMFGQAADVLDRLVLAFDVYANRRREEQP
jgi:hypothetical protein